MITTGSKHLMKTNWRPLSLTKLPSLSMGNFLTKIFSDTIDGATFVHRLAKRILTRKKVAGSSMQLIRPRHCGSADLPTAERLQERHLPRASSPCRSANRKYC